MDDHLAAAHSGALACLKALRKILFLVDHPLNQRERLAGWPARPCFGAEELEQAIVHLGEAWSAGKDAYRQSKRKWESTRHARGPAAFLGLSKQNSHRLTYFLVLKAMRLVKAAARNAATSGGDPETISGWTAWAYYSMLSGLGLSEAELNMLQGELEWEYAEAQAPKTKAKRSTEGGEARLKLIAALTKHHSYENGGCLNLEPIGNNELARQAEVSVSTASAFFTKEFKGHTEYRTLCGDATRLVAALKLLTQEFSPHDLYGRRPPGEDECGDEE